VKANVKERLEIKKKEMARRSTSPRKEVKSQDNGDKAKTVKVKETKFSTVVLVANGAKVESRPTTVAGVKIKQPKDLRSRLSEKKVDQDVGNDQKSVEKDAVKLEKEKELDARIQRIQQQNEAILKRAKEIQAEKLKFS